MGFLGGLIGAIGGAFAAIGGAIGAGLAILSGPVVGTILTAIQVVAGVVGMFKNNETPQEIGDRVLQAEEEGIKPEKFEKFEEYQKKIDEFKVDPVKSNEISNDDKNRKFIEYTGMAIADKFEVDPTKFLINEIPKNPDFYTKERVNSYIETFSNTKKNLDTISNYMDNKITDIDEIKSVRNTLIDGEKRISGNEGKSDVELLEIINDEKRI